MTSGFMNGSAQPTIRQVKSKWTLPRNQAIVLAFLVLGILLRLRQYLFDRSLWLDESLLVLNIVRRSPAELLKPLANHQSAPIGFLLLEKLAVHYLGPGEMALRLVPFLCGLLSIFLFVAVSRWFLAPMAVSIAVGLFSISGPLIYYSSEAKQYSGDVAVILGLYLLAGYWMEAESDAIRAIVASVVGGVAIWFSQPAVFVMTGLGLGALWTSARKNNRRALFLAAIPCVVWATSFLVLYWFSLRHLTDDTWLLWYWKGAFAPLLYSLQGVRWYTETFFAVLSDPVGLTLLGIAGVAAIVGARQFFAERRNAFTLLLLPVALTLLASGVHRYPFRGRLLLFLVPSVILLIASGLETIHRKTRDSVPLLGVLLVGFLFFHPLMEASRYFVRPHSVEEIRPVIAYMEKHRASGDLLYSYYGSKESLDYYRQLGVIGPIDTVIGVESREHWKPYREDLDKLHGNPRVWVLFSHVYREGGVDEERLFLDHLDGEGKRLDSSLAIGASVYLYDLTQEKGETADKSSN